MALTSRSREVGNVGASQHYVRGRHLRYAQNDHWGALNEYEQAIAADPGHGPSWVGVAEENVFAAAYGMKPWKEAYAAAESALATAARLQGEPADAVYVAGVMAVSERRWNDAERALAHACENEPDHVAARCWMATVLSMRGRIDEALGHFRHARELDPLAPYPCSMAALGLMHARRFDDANQMVEQALAFDENNSLALWVSGAIQAGLGRPDIAVTRFERAHNTALRSAFILGGLVWALAAAGRTDEARAAQRELRAQSFASPVILSEAWFLAAMGDHDGAFEVLDRATGERNLILAFSGFPALDPLRSDPRFRAFEERLQQPVEAQR